LAGQALISDSGATASEQQLSEPKPFLTPLQKLPWQKEQVCLISSLNADPEDGIGGQNLHRAE
jgi:hypothetical protein